MEGAPNKQYGLILPKKAQLAPVPTLVAKPSVFEDSDSDGETPANWVQKTLQKEKYGGGARSKHSKAEIEKILKEDPTVYEYDEVYDDIQKKRNEVAAAKQAEKVERKPRYIQHLLATADKRKKENERRIARQVQKEREAEGDEFADKEVFVTASYKKKLEEMKAAEEEEKRQERLEAIGDVTKQGDLSGFYRHLYEKVVLDVDDLKETDSKLPSLKKREKQQAKSRQYRKRKSSESDGDEGDESGAVKRKPEAESSKNEESEDVSSTTNNIETEKPISNVLDASVPPEQENPDADSESEKGIKEEPNEEEKDEEGEESTVPEEPPKPKINIWEKRTVREVFEDALQRYYERKAARLTAAGC